MLDLRKPEAVEVYLDLVRGADVVVGGDAPRLARARGLGYAELREVNPKIVFCNISGYGETGPYKDLPAHGIALRHLGRHRRRRDATTRASATSPSTPRSASTPAR